MELNAHNTHLQLVYDHSNSDLTEKYIKTKQLDDRLKEQKQAQVTKLYTRSKDITDTSVAAKYLTKARNITCTLGKDLKTAGIYEGEQNRYLPALIAFARDSEGNITGGQQILLNKNSGAKANVDIPKRSFGKIAGSFVEVGIINHNHNNSDNGVIVIIAEGLETALSIKQALSLERSESAANTKILCSLGVTNIGNYRAKQGERIIIAADNDGVNSKTNKTIENAKISMESLGSFVEIVKPNREGDFNDVLKADGIGSIQESFKGAIARHSAKTLADYITHQEKSGKDQDHELNKEDKENLSYIERYNLSQEKLVDAWRKNPLQGKLILDSMRKEVNMAQYHLQANKPILDLAKNYNIVIDENNMIRALLEKNDVSAEQYCMEQTLSKFNGQKQSEQHSRQIFEVIQKEDRFLSEVSLRHKEHLDDALKSRIEMSQSGASKDITCTIKQNLEANYKQGIVSDHDLSKILLSPDLKTIASNLQDRVASGRSNNLSAVRVQLIELDKLGYKYDKDDLVSNLKSMSYEEKTKYADRILAEQTRKYIEPLFTKHAREKENAGDFKEFLKAIEREQEMHVYLHEKHPLALYALDKQNGNLKFSMLVTAAHDLHTKVGMRTVIDTINYAIRYKDIHQERITSDLKSHNVNLKSLYESLNDKSDYQKSQITENKSLTRTKNTDNKHDEQNKKSEIKVERDFSM